MCVASSFDTTTMGGRAALGGRTSGTALLNAGDGRSAHPTQGLLDMLTLRQAKGDDFSRLRIAIVGDVRHSRVARSDLHALRVLGAGDIRVCGPAALCPMTTPSRAVASRTISTRRSRAPMP